MEVKALELEVKNPELKDKRRRKPAVKSIDSKKCKTLLGIKKETKEVTIQFIWMGQDWEPTPPFHKKSPKNGDTPPHPPTLGGYGYAIPKIEEGGQKLIPLPA